ncbi:unnamed protein product [Rotaria sp. Silwood1]|nr:unnamed protein product [Rotaria sp. Silwood1]CAF1126544.1 unnamed protein product [Rotaria sp. Silwood1]CAF1252427.1 unnamed protein product [Rotaria sp. Silwood1]CAF3460828.1 unnamed protein product [Rotaria sp. Silwood1]CAF3482672.1 unnamed protein product [Rotaria sp. Silwood1]
MSSSSNTNVDVSNSKIATEAAPPGMNSFTNTVGMQPNTNETSSQQCPSNIRRGSCDRPGCTDEHSGKPHE